MSQDAPTAPAEVVEVSNATNGEAGGSVTNSSATVAPVASPSAPTPSGVVEEKPKAEVPLAERLKVSMDLPVSTSTSKKERPKVVLAAWQPDEGVSECLHCKRSFNPLFLRFKHHCRICGNIFCGSCTKQTAIRQADLPPELLTCLPCNEAELKRQEKEIKKQQARDALKIEQEHLSELFVELQKAFEANDEAKALLLKSEIDRLKEKMIAREQVRQARKDEKTKEKKAAKIAKKAAAAAEKEAAAGKSGAGASKSTAGAAKSGAVAKKGAKTTTSKPVNKKALDTPDTINTKLETRFSLEPSKLLNAPYDPTRKCLVLDIDYTLFDHKWQPQVRSDLRSNKTMIPLFKRPYLHEFLATCNLKYDIIIWSATGMPAIDNKVGNLGIYTSDRYKLTAVLCKDHMIHVTRPRKGGRTYDETVKPLAVIWKKFPEYYNPTNTIHIDDMISNFQLNPLNGIHISPYKESATATLPDTELQYLTKYLMLIAETESDFSRLPHSKWKEWLIDRLWQDSLLTTSLPAHIPDPPIDPALLIAAEMASKSKKKDTSTAVSATSSAASSSAPSAASSATSSAPTNANSTAGSSSSLTASTSPSTDIPRSATPAMNEDAKISTLLSSSPATPTGTPPTTSQLKSATLSRAGSGLAINTALVSTSGPTSPKSPVTSPDGKFPSSPGTLSPSSSLDRLAMAAAIASAGASPSSPSSGTSTPTASTWVRSAFPRPTLSNSLSELPTIVPGTPPSTSPAPISVSTPTAPSSSESNNTSSPTSPALSVSTTATGTPQATTPEKSVPASPTTPPASNLAPSP